MSEQIIDKEFLAKLDEIIIKAIDFGGLLVVGTRGCGKTNASQWIARRIIDNPKHESNEFKMMIFDDCSNWKWSFDKIPFVNYDGVHSLPMTKDLIVNLQMIDSIEVRNAISQIMIQDFQHKMVLKEQLNGIVPFTSIYFVEEIQSIWGRYGLSGLSGRFNFKMIAEGRNYGMVIFGIGQRLADIDTRIYERIRYYLFGATSGSNDLLKIRRIGGKELADAVNSLERGEFAYFDKDDKEIEVIGFPIFKQIGRPEPINIDNKRGFVKTLFKGR